MTKHIGVRDPFTAGRLETPVRNMVRSIIGFFVPLVLAAIAFGIGAHFLGH